MKSTVTTALMLFLALTLSGCRQADGPIPKPDPNTEGELEDVRHDLQNIAMGDASGAADLENDVVKYARRRSEVPAVTELCKRTADVLKGRNLTEPTAIRLAHSLWTAIAARQISERQIEALQNDVQSIFVSIGVPEPQAQQVAAQVGEVQKAVTQKPRRWYELF
jgi:hypothetical protein